MRVRRRPRHRVALVTLAAELETLGPGSLLRNALRRALGDPTLEIAYLRVGSGGWINEAGRTMTDPVEVEGRAATPIERDGKPIASLIHDPALLRDPERLRAAITATGIAFDNGRAGAELRAEVQDLRKALTRLTDASDNERRRVERNLHDGAQQRLVGLALTLRMTANRAAGDPGLAALVAEAAAELDAALGELRELARGIHPAIVAATGLAGALEALAERPGVPVTLAVDFPVPLPALVETTAYYVVAEALTNANKHAEASGVWVTAALAGDVLRVSVTDDGRGGARASSGSGLEGLADRVGALGGTLALTSAAGSGTVVSAELPLTADVTAARDPRRTLALQWVGWETYEMPGEAYDQLVDEDNLSWARGLFAIAGGASRVTGAERAWVVGQQAGSGTAAWVLEAIRTYDVDESIEDVVALPGMRMTGRALLYDTLRMSQVTGEVDPARLATIRTAATRLDLPADLVDDLHAVVLGELALRRQRYGLITAPILPST